MALLVIKALFPSSHTRIDSGAKFTNMYPKPPASATRSPPATPTTPSEYKPSFYTGVPPPPSPFTPGFSSVAELEQSAISAEANRTQALLNHIADLRNLLKQQIEHTNVSNNAKAQLQTSLAQHEMYTDFMASVNAAEGSSEMYAVASEKVKSMFKSQFATLYTLDSKTHSLVTSSDSGVSE